MQGLEFVVAYDPLQAAAQTDTQFAHEPSNVWVIRKQMRRKRAGQEDEVVVLATFFVVGDCIYMAPSVASVVGNRIVRRRWFCFAHVRKGMADQLASALCCHIANQSFENRLHAANLHPGPWAYLSTTSSETR